MTKKKKNRKEEQKKKQEATLKKMKKVRQLDSDNLRELLKGKRVWIELELKKGELHKKGLETQLEKLKTQMDRLEGMKLLIEDLFMPSEEKVEKKEK